MMPTWFGVSKKNGGRENQAISKAQADNDICYADAFDPLIDAGWEIVQALEEDTKRNEEV